MCAWSVRRSELQPNAPGLPLASRRDVVRGSLWAALLAGGLLKSGAAAAADEGLAFGATSMQEALSALGGIPAVGEQIVLTAPDAAEDGAVVPVSVACSLPGVRELFIVVESNPNPLVVRFSIPEGTEPYIATRVKMADSGNVYAVAKTADKLYAACRRTQVTVGGCG
jgi:sulfur-oxidizing protein SoxY